MSYRKIVVPLILGTLVVCGAFQAWAEMNASEKDVSVRKLGVAWNIAEDRKMENISGVYEPEGLDKYMKRYFEQLTATVDQLSEEIKRLEKKVDELRDKSNQPLVSQPQKLF